ncbi:MAG TPA: hypothetical protein VFZ23_06500 [Pyrinomonadaceae bacterium]
MTDKLEFISSLTEIGAELGLAVTMAEVETSMPPALRVPNGLEFSHPKPADLRRWVPVEVSNHGSPPAVDWCYMGSSRFTRPFFEDTIRQQFRMPFSRMFRHRTSIECVGELVDKSPGIPPTGFIFHMSRCGSTLVSQMLAAVDKNIVISEAPPIDSVLNAKPADSDDDQRALWLKWIVGALGQKRFDREQYFFIKFDSWSTLDLDLIQSAFPSVPWIFLYRNPVEVIVSQLRQRGSHMIPGNLDKFMPGIALAEALEIPAEEYCARILERICEAGITHARNANALLVNYSQLPEAVTSVVADHFGVAFDNDDISKMLKAANFNAKTPQLFFEPDSEQKREEATDAVRRAAGRIKPLYCELERVRLNAS